jgi:hypothetical protein
MLKIEQECYRFDEDGEVVGHFVLSDGTKTKFCIYRQYNKVEWQQWNNGTSQLGVTVDRIEQLMRDLSNQIQER